MVHSKHKLNISRLLTVLMALAVLMSSFLTVYAADFAGNCTSDISWNIQGGTLKISGAGAMPDYSETNLPPWYGYADSILYIEVSEGVTHIGSFAFMKLDHAQTVTVGHTVLTIGDYAFYDCSAVERIYMSENLTEIGRSAFERCRSLKSISLPGSLQTLRSSAFYRCESLLSIVIPASVRTLEQKTFAYCKSLRTATILANIEEIPYWTFYGCYELQSVSLSASITEVGVSAFENCESLTKANYGGTGEEAEAVYQQISTSVPTLDHFKEGQNIINVGHTSTNTTTSTGSNGAPVITQETFFGGQNAVIETQKVTQNNGITVTVDAILENQEGWKDVDEQVTGALIASPNLQGVQVNIYMDARNVVAGVDLARFEKKDIDILLHTTQGAVWYVNGEDISAGKLQQSYDLSYSLRPLNNLTESQSKAIGSGTAYGLTFLGNIDFKAKLALPLEQARSVASIFLEEEGSYKLSHKVMINDQKIAQFYLGQVTAGVEYLIGINVPTSYDDMSQVIVPNPKPGVYVPMDFVEEVPHLVSPPISSLGIDVSQLTWIMVGGMVALAVVVGVVVKLMWKQKLRKGYVPEFDDEDPE